MTHPLFRRHIALTQEHGSWVFLFSPLLIGLFAAGSIPPAAWWFTLTALGVFLFRQPLTFAVKIYAGRRSRNDLPAAVFWMVVYGALALTGFIFLAAGGLGWLAILALPGLPILLWHLRLVSKRAERRQIGMEIIASGVLALAAPGAFWAAGGQYAVAGWWLWVLSWLQSAGSITYAALRLEQRTWTADPGVADKFRAARRSLLYTTFNLLLALGAGLAGWIPAWVWLAFAVQWVENLWGALRPAVRARPTAIGLRQLFVSVVFTVVFILAWRLSV